MINHPAPVIHVGRYSDLLALMRKARYSRNFRNQALDMVAKELQATPDPDHVLNQVRNHLRSASTDEKRLLICVMENCRLESPALHLALGGGFNITPFQSNGQPSLKPGWFHAHGEQPVEYRRAILLGRISSQSTIEWANRFIHEATHFSDFELTQKWIDANIELLKRGRTPDELFSNFVRVKEDGRRIDLDEGFFRAFLESRAYYAEFAGPRKLFGSIYDEMNPHDRRMAMDDIRDFSGVTAAVVQKYHLTESNIFEAGDRFGREMAATIREAKALGGS
jgi:hypothetical protein